MTRGVREILERDGNKDDLIAFFMDRNLPVEEIEANNIAEAVLEDKPAQGYLTISNALQWRLQYTREAMTHLKVHDPDFYPKTIIEPTCGVGAFLLAAADAYPDAERVVGLEIESEYLNTLRSEVANRADAGRFELIEADFFKTDWAKLLGALPEPILIVGNPPWVTSADIGNGRVKETRLKAIVTQKKVGQPTDYIREEAPLTWAYLEKHGEALDSRGSSIYRNKARFSVFGVGDYTFTDWKVAISGFYKKLNFQVVAPIDGRPVVFDDTVYCLSAKSEAEARFLAERVDLRKVAAALGREDEYVLFTEGPLANDEPLACAS
ncbi:unnamed protein product [Cyprideis torosa]|uniref:Uncharacterized protein n=1 Tax=Cyprideis torosa TaxID=163714 RepID=A0A7R8WMN1_9CRUS|nr:unnamed protein product [Cyprideis torosa]CAG0903850.1 unnamed protein product [Cyprideis torosa]